MTALTLKVSKHSIARPRRSRKCSRSINSHCSRSVRWCCSSVSYGAKCSCANSITTRPSSHIHQLSINARTTTTKAQRSARAISKANLAPCRHKRADKTALALRSDHITPSRHALWATITPKLPYTVGPASHFTKCLAHLRSLAVKVVLQENVKKAYMTIHVEEQLVFTSAKSRESVWSIPDNELPEL